MAGKSKRGDLCNAGCGEERNGQREKSDGENDGRNLRAVSQAAGNLFHRTTDMITDCQTFADEIVGAVFLCRKELAGVPAKALALLFGDFLEEREGVRAAILRAGGEKRVQQGNRSDVGGTKRGGLGRGNENLVAFAGERGKVGVRDADAVGPAGAGLLNTLDGLAKTAAESDSQNQILFGEGANEVRDAARGGCGKYGQTEEADLVFQVFRERGGQVAGQQKNAARFVETFGQGGEALRVEAVFQALQILEVLTEGITHVGRHIGIAAAGLHSVKRGGEREGEFVQVMLKFAVGGEAEASNNAHDRRGVGAQALGHGANAQEDVFARMLEDGANHFLALGAELLDTLGKIDDRWLSVRGGFLHAPRELRKTICMSTPRTAISLECQEKCSGYFSEAAALVARPGATMGWRNGIM